jgi:hypothetical protein
MKLVDLLPDSAALLALEPDDELGLRILPVLAEWRHVGNPMTLSTFVDSVVGGKSPNYPGQYPSHQRAEIGMALREAWTWLEGQALLIESPAFVSPTSVRALSRRAQLLAKEPDAQKVYGTRRLRKEALHSSIREDVWALYHRGKYDTAVFEAMKAVEV